jgi:prepilin-type N-terminal cleavage/methylation domain-containing protein
MPISSVGRTSSASRATSTAGITLIEMMVVLAIIGFMVAISAPSLIAGLDSVRMASATDSIASFLNAAVNRAERRQQPIEIVISPKENRMVLYSNEPGYTRELQMPTGILLETVVPAEAAGPDGLCRLILLPGASVPGIGVQVASTRGGKRIVRLDPMTGYPRVESVKAE